MPVARIIGNAILSFMSKMSTGYWDIFDPTNGYTAVHAKVVSHLQLSKISKRYFFESDMLFRLNLMRCVVLDIPMDPEYGDEVSNLKITSVLGDFLSKHLRNTAKRIFYSYYLRDLSPASLNLVLGIVSTLFGAIYGGFHWYSSATQNAFATAGTVMISALPLILGMQLLLAFLTQDMQSTPRQPIHRRLT
jgi:dolichol-phosphate mannosyltransferase